MTQESIQVFKNEVYSKPPKKNYNTNKTDVHHFDDIWNLDILDLKGFASEIVRGYRFVLVIVHNFSKFVWTTPLKKK